jgi:hypothetical protein
MYILRISALVPLSLRMEGLAAVGIYDLRPFHRLCLRLQLAKELALEAL